MTPLEALNDILESILMGICTVLSGIFGIFIVGLVVGIIYSHIVGPLY